MTGGTGGPMLELSGVRASYGSIEVLSGVNLSVGSGEVVALLGPNGGGKSTVLKVIAGLLPATAGEVRMAGRAVNGAGPDDLARRGVCLIPEGKGVFPNLSVRENLWMATHAGVAVDAVEAVAYELFPPLGRRRKQLAGTLSGGEQQMLAMSRALATNPAVLLLDELSMGLAPLIVRELYGVVRQAARAGASVLVVEQFARAVLGVADRAAIMLQGRVTRTASPEEIEQELARAYLKGR